MTHRERAEEILRHFRPDFGWQERDRELTERVIAAVRNEALEEAVEACEELEMDFGNEHAELCDCMTPVEDECNCHLSKFRKTIEALKVKP